MSSLGMQLLPGRLTVAQLSPQAPFPLDWEQHGDLFGIVRTQEELSVVCAEGSVPEGVRQETGWRALKVSGPLDFSLVGILSQIVSTLAQAGVSIFALSTYNTDYILVKEACLPEALQALRQAGHIVNNGA